LFPLFPCFLVSLFPCFLVYLSTCLPTKTPRPQHIARDEASNLAVPPCLSRKTGPALSPWASQTTARLITAALPGPTTTFHVSRFTFHVSRFTFCSPNSPAHSSASWLPRSHPRRLSEARFAATCPVHSRSYFDWREYATAVRGCQTNRLETAFCPVPRLSGELPMVNKCCRLWICRPNDLLRRPGDSSVVESDRSSRPLRA
jgi:hypothetical protein